MSKSSAKVVIVGAGAAGVAAAAQLVNNGLDDVIVLEAQNYVGGRVKGQIVDGKNIDLGAQFVHGWEDNPAFEIAQKLQTIAFLDGAYDSTRLQNAPKEFINTQGEKVPGTRVCHFLDFLYSELDARFDQPLEDDGKSSDGEFFVKTYKKFMEMNKDSLSQEDKELYDAVYRWHSAYHKIDNAIADLQELSAWGASKYRVLGGDRFTNVHGGMAAILKAVADLIPKGIIRLNTPVANIDWTSVKDLPSDGKLVVTCKNGDVIEAEHVIVTVSTGCLQAYHKQLFQPSLPAPFQTALQHIGFGGIGKIFLKFEKPFWNLSGTGYFESFEWLWLDSHSVSIKSDKCEKKTRVIIGHYLQFLCSKFGKPWWYGIQSVETVLDHPNMLEFWLTLDQVEIVEELSDEEVLNVCHELLRNFLKEYDTIPKPVEVYKTKWLTNPYILGTYSYPKREIHEVDMENFGSPLPSTENPRLLFAGEAYSIDFISTFHGAYLSGIKRADLLLKIHGLQPSQNLVNLIGQPGN